MSTEQSPDAERRRETEGAEGAAGGRERRRETEGAEGAAGGRERRRETEGAEGAAGGRERRVDEQRLDELQRLWTPWRMAYIRDPDRTTTGCPFCVLPEARDDRRSLIVHRGETGFVILNAYPYNPGHLMIVPYRHVGPFVALTQEEVCEMALLSQRAVRALTMCSDPHAFNLGINVGDVAGAGIADHIHQHVVPRWGGDTNFMPVVASTRVLPELLDETYDRLVPAFADA